jgi:D-arabinan exo alpha-(1,3)/(1,5)-arabinofuranosidase (non-reducing end)
VKFYFLLITMLMLIFNDSHADQRKNPGHSRSFLSNAPLWLPSDASSHRFAKVGSLHSGEKETYAELDGPAIIKHIWITAKCDIPQIYGLLVLRVWWDDEKEPSIEVPLGDFFGVGFGKELEFSSLVLEMLPAGLAHHSSLNSYWEMPFRKSARFEIENRGTRNVSLFFIQIEYEKHKNLPEETMYFHSRYRRENPVGLHVPYTILEAKGRGKYVGTIFNYHLLGPGAWVEGGQDFYIDGEKKPSLPGIGGEDYFGHAWGFKKEKNSLLHGTSYGPRDNKMTAYRFHIPDPVMFKKSIRATMRCHGWDVQDRQDDYSSVAFWYQDEPHSPFPELPKVDFDLLDMKNPFLMTPAEMMKNLEEKINFKGSNLSINVKNYKESGHHLPEQSGNMAFDGDSGTKWCEVKNPDMHWLVLDLGRECEVEGVVIKNPSVAGESSGFDVVAFNIDIGESLDGPFIKIAEWGEDKDEKPSSLNILPFEKIVKGRFFRLYISKSCMDDKFARIHEFEIWGKTGEEKWLKNKYKE